MLLQTADTKGRRVTPKEARLLLPGALFSVSQTVISLDNWEFRSEVSIILLQRAGPGTYIQAL